MLCNVTHALTAGLLTLTMIFQGPIGRIAKLNEAEPALISFDPATPVKVYLKACMNPIVTKLQR